MTDATLSKSRFRPGGRLDILAANHAAHIARVKEKGGPVLSYSPPCGCPPIETPAPKDERETWDSLTTCVHCGALFMKIVRRGSVECRTLPA
jgi:hypothetical protein